MSETIREGGCGCGHVRYRVRGEPMMVHNCHCHLCQQQTGSTSVVNLFIESDRVEILSGEMTEHTVKTGSGKDHILVRCGQCGVCVFSYYARLGRLAYAVRVGTLDDPDSVTPDVVIFTESKMPWVALPEGIPHFEKYYDFREVLPEESNARLMALAERRQAGEG